MDAKIASKIAELEAKIAALQAKDKELEDGILYHINLHYDLHEELNSIIMASYVRTHPEHIKSMNQFDHIIGRKFRDLGKPKS